MARRKPLTMPRFVFILAMLLAVVVALMMLTIKVR